MLSVRGASVIFLLGTLRSARFLLLNFFGERHCSANVFVVVVRFSNEGCVGEFQAIAAPSGTGGVGRIFCQAIRRVKVRVPLMLFGIFCVRVGACLASPFAFCDCGVSGFVGNAHYNGALRRRVQE